MIKLQEQRKGFDMGCQMLFLLIVPVIALGQLYNNEKPRTHSSLPGSRYAGMLYDLA